MQYLGGKSKIRKQIANFLEDIRKPNQIYFEPFVGGAWILQEMSGKRIASDGNYALISMYKALQKGWQPPKNVDEDLYYEVKSKMDMDNPLTAFIGIGCSFGGKWFGGLARQKGYNFAIGGGNSLKKQLPKTQDVEFRYGMFQEHNPENMLVYCDPPYEGTTQYGAFDGFNHALFWDTMREWSKKNTVVVSEYNAPSDFGCVLEIKTKSIIRDSNNRPIPAIERLFMKERFAA